MFATTVDLSTKLGKITRLNTNWDLNSIGNWDLSSPVENCDLSSIDMQAD